MQQLTDEGRRIVDDVARRHGFSSDAVTSMLISVWLGMATRRSSTIRSSAASANGRKGGMTMIGDMFNNNLKGRVASLCQELAGLIQNQPMFAVPAQSQSQSQGGGWQGQSGGSFQQQGSGGGGFGGVKPVRAQRAERQMVASGSGISRIDGRAEQSEVRLLSPRRAAWRSMSADRSRFTIRAIIRSAGFRSSRAATSRSRSPASSDWCGSPTCRGSARPVRCRSLAVRRNRDQPAASAARTAICASAADDIAGSSHGARPWERQDNGVIRRDILSDREALRSAQERHPQRQRIRNEEERAPWTTLQARGRLSFLRG